jgi:hypothetical protein
MRFTIEENRDAIKRYRHIKPAPRWGVVHCSARCPGTLRTCSLERGHTGLHVAHGLFRRVLAVWDRGTKTPTASEKSKRPGRTVARVGSGKMGVVEFFQGIRGQIMRREQSVEEILLLVFAVSMVGFVIDWAARIIGWW